MEDDDDVNQIPIDFKRHCFIEELCTCELKEAQAKKNISAQADHKFNDQHLHFNHQLSAQLNHNSRRISTSERFQPGEFKNLLKQTSMAPIDDKQELR